ncbi:MAG: hypothetical protein KatS3mg110_1307 [Pirellulaceae bacterium]|nr:MAG: hypothetical protein KatS3mg110_1307 [Pirellulaceae bacterium]
MDWSERFGRASAAMGASAGVAGPVLRLEWEGGRYQLPVLLIAPDAHDPLHVGRQWEAEGLEHEVAEEIRRGGQSAYLVQVRSPIGWKRQVVRPATTRRVVELSERFFVGQGKRHLLQLRVTRQEPVDAAQHAAWLQAFDQLHRLRPDAVDGSAETPALSAEKSAELRDRLTRLTSSAPTQWQHLVQTALQQLQQAQTRQAGLEFVRRQALEKTLPELQIEAVRGTAPARDQLANRVVVLHFWDYRDAPLHEPYGQVGYLDFLYRKYADQGVVVLGVVTNQQSESPGGRRTAAVGARKFASFMNLAYPVVQDGGALLRYVGDPRLHDGALPLFVVVDRSGKIIHYWSGYYPVDTQRGLVELEGVIRQALQTAP